MLTINGSFGQTHVGKVRKENEDRFLINVWPEQPAVLAVVADGMGSYGGGADAAQAVVEAFSELLHQPLPETVSCQYEMLLGAFYAADAQIRVLQSSSFPDMGATALATIITPNYLLYLHAGDCRLYHFKDEEPVFYSHDHSIIQALIDSGTIDEHQAARHPMRNIVTSCLGGPQANSRLSIDPQWNSDDQEFPGEFGPQRPLSSGDIIVMCSDGLWSDIRCSELSEIVGQAVANVSRAETLSSKLAETALSRTGADNITAIVFDVDALRVSLELSGPPAAYSRQRS
jgi:PPM family protein phosphatase